MTPEQRFRLVRALVASDAAGRSIAATTIDEYARATATGPFDDDDIVLMVERHIREQADALVHARGPLTAAVGLAEKWSARTKPATAKRQATSRHWAERALALQAEGKSVAQVALTLSAERGKETAPRVVERWLAAEKVPTERRPVRLNDETSG